MKDRNYEAFCPECGELLSGKATICSDGDAVCSARCREVREAWYLLPLQAGMFDE